MSQQDNKDMAKHFYRASAADFKKIPGSPVAYWISDKTRNVFLGENLGLHFDTEGQNKTTNNEKFLRYLWEVVHSSIGKGNRWIRCAKVSVKSTLIPL